METMNKEDELWDNMRDAYDLVKGGKVKRADGEGFKVYSAGTIIRIDIEEAK